MPIERFRSLDAARDALWTDGDDPRLAERIRKLWAFSARLAPPIVPRGVQRFRSIEEANAEREAREVARVARLRAERTASRSDSRADG